MTLATLLVAAALAQAQDPRSFDIPAGPTLSSINRLAAQAGVDVVVTADLSRRQSPPVRGVMGVDSAFDRLLAPVGARAVRLTDRLYRIELPVSAHRRVASTAPPSPASPDLSLAPTLLDEITVTASVRRGGLEGANGRSSIDPTALLRVQGVAGSDGVADLSSTVDSTRQGPGRNKLFIRGVADSAFNGPLQATVGQYLGDLRLNYGSPDPDLLLVDIQGIEVFEGPQSSRFGAGSLGGVIRVHPEPPRFEETTMQIASGVSATSGGSLGQDAVMVLNRPMGDIGALRVVAYGRRDGGFLDNPVRAEDNADYVDTLGLRVSARAVIEGWTIDGLAVAQNISSPDAQTVSTTASAPVKTRAIAEPYESALTLIGISANRRFESVRFTTSASLSRQILDERFDASDGTQQGHDAVDRRQTVSALSAEARLEWDNGGFWSLNGGVALAAGQTQALRERQQVFADATTSGGSNLRRRFAEGAVFMEAIAAPAEGWDVALGGRLSFAQASHNIAVRSFGEEAAEFAKESERVSTFFSPTAAIRWTPEDGPVVFARLERGVRPGSISEEQGMLERHRADRVTLLETGLQTSSPSQGWTAEASIGWLDWRDVQADMVTQGGDLVTGNVGDGWVRFFQAKAAWTPTPSLSLSGSLFLNESRLRLAGPNVIGVSEGDIPNVARSGVQFSVSHDPGYFAGQPLNLSADLRYIGRSRPGLGPYLDVLQGGYWRTDLSARWGNERVAAVLKLSNPLDTWAIRYGVGSPYQLNSPQGAPLRPLTLRLGLEVAF